MSFLDELSAQEIFDRLGGRGRTYNGGFFTFCPSHQDSNPSLHIWTKNGRAYVHCHGGCPFMTVRNDIAKIVSDPMALRCVASAPIPQKRKGRVKTPPDYVHQPVPEWAPPAPEEVHFTRDDVRKVQLKYTYRDAQGRLLGYITRFPDPEMGKTFRPLVFVRWNNGKDAWTIQWGFPSPRPIYNLHKIAARPKAPILFCEGEKAANAAERLFPNCVPTSTMNGSSSTQHADVSIVKGRDCIISPDYDAPGTSYAAQLSMMLHDAGALSVSLLDWPLDVVPDGKGAFTIRRGSAKKGYDLADAEEEGWTAGLLDQMKSRGWRGLSRIIFPTEDLPALRNATNGDSV